MKKVSHVQNSQLRLIAIKPHSFYFSVLYRWFWGKKYQQKHTPHCKLYTFRSKL